MPLLAIRSYNQANHNSSSWSSLRDCGVMPISREQRDGPPKTGTGYAGGVPEVLDWSPCPVKAPPAPSPPEREGPPRPIQLKSPPCRAITADTAKAPPVDSVPQPGAMRIGLSWPGGSPAGFRHAKMFPT